MNSSYGSNLSYVKQLIARAAESCGRNGDEITLMAVSKTHSIEAINAMAGCGQMLFGENRIQEIEKKFDTDSRSFSLHMIGHLQSNKVKKAVALVDSIDSVDSLKLARLIGKAALHNGKTIDILIEYNTSKEESKSGFLNEDEYYSFLDEVGSIEGIREKGLMTIGPLSPDEKATHEAFATLYRLQQRSIQRHPELDFGVLSMGMSQDIVIAKQEGSTMVRIGTALFGKRE